jgi:adenosylhomocysteine nucleosidase
LARVARQHALPFAVLRAVCDPVSRDLPYAAMVALDAAGTISAWRVASAVLSRPWEIPALIRLAGDAARARHALVTRVRALGRL